MRMHVIKLFKKCVCLTLVVACLEPIGSTGRAQEIVLTDVTDKTGITFVHTDGSFGKRYMMENVTAGIALLDYDNDGDIDIYFLNGGILKGNPSKEKPANALYRNDGNWKFTDVTAEAGVGDTGHALGVVAGDYDNDGDLDIYVNNHGPNVLYRNNGDGTFTDVTEQAGVANGDQMGAGACFLDADADGDLDLYVSNYVVFDYSKHVIKTVKGYPKYSGPPNYPTTVDALFRNNGDGTFTDVTEESGIAVGSGSGMGTVCADYDNDGDTDIFVANDMGANFLFQNDGKGKFEEVGLFSGFAYDLHGEEYGSMGPDCGDYDNDGLLDIYLTSYQKQSTTLYRNLGDGFFEDVTRNTGAGDATFSLVTWGNAFVDFDHDGDRDIFVASG
ncbi:MAG: FG-GAP repeat domain-containing protein, partial [Planctomycetota bacterium]